MTGRAIARQYANALFDVAERAGQVEAIGRELSEFAAIVRSHGELARVLGSAAIGTDRKTALVQALLEASGSASAEVRRLLLLLAERDRLMFLDDIAALYSERAMAAGGLVRAELTSAAALDGRVRDEIVSALVRALDRKVTVTERVDPNLIGGVVARVGSVVYDGSVARHLERLREKLLADLDGSDISSTGRARGTKDEGHADQGRRNLQDHP